MADTEGVPRWTKHDELINYICAATRGEQEVETWESDAAAEVERYQRAFAWWVERQYNAGK